MAEGSVLWTCLQASTFIMSCGCTSGRLGFLRFINRSRTSEVAVFIPGGISAGCRRDYLAHRGGQLWALNPGMSGIASAAGIKTQLTPDGQSHVAVSLQASAQARLRGLRCSITPQSRTEGPVISLLHLSQSGTFLQMCAGVRGTSLRVNRCDR